MSVTEYRETIDYTWVVARQLDRVAEALTKLSYDAVGVGLRRAYMAVRALHTITQPLMKEDLRGMLREVLKYIKEGNNSRALDTLESVVGAVLKELDRRGLLVRRHELLTGEYGGADTE